MTPIALLCLARPEVTRAGAVLGRTRRRNQSGIHHGARLKQKAKGGQLGIDDLQDLGAQLVLFEQVPKPQDADPV